MKKKINWILVLSLVITLVSLVILIGLIVILNLSSREYLKKLQLQKTTDLPPASPEIVLPSELLEQKSFYSGKKITLRGRVFQDSVVCIRKECPEEDSCCGCPEERNILVVDPNSVLNQQIKEKLTLLDFQGKSLCQREKGSCRYNCGDWINGGIYDIYGEFWAEAPPPGWNKSLEFYFKVKEKNLLKTTSFEDKIKSLFNDIKDLIQKQKTSGYYILQ